MAFQRVRPHQAGRGHVHLNVRSLLLLLGLAVSGDEYLSAERWGIADHDSDYRLVAVWGGFSLRWYAELFRSGDVLGAALLSLRIAAVSASVAAALGTLALLCGSAWSARVVEVRVGSHPTFTRVVFELDSPVGYKVERRAPSAGGNELVVSLNASAQARTLRRKLKFIESLQVRSRAGRSTRSVGPVV